MLVLSRKESESIRIGQNVTVVVLSVRGGRVRLGIEAPPEVSIARGELRWTDQFSRPGRFGQECDSPVAGSFYAG